MTSKAVNIMKKVKEKILTLVAYYILYPACVKKFNFSIMSDAETIDAIIEKHLSISRFGDGEYKIILGGGIGFQTADSRLAERLKEVLEAKEEGHLNCVPLIFKETKGLTRHAALYCRAFTVSHAHEYREYTPQMRLYGAAGFTRFYADFKNKDYRYMKRKIDKIRSIWENRNVYLVEGEFSRCGVGNDLFDNALSVHRIICPAVDAWYRYDDIKKSIIDIVPQENALILCMLGPTATVLAYDLFKKGYQALDMGHIDIEYEWFSKGVKWKEPVVGKAVNERGGNYPQNPISTSRYEEEIIISLT